MVPPNNGMLLCVMQSAAVTRHVNEARGRHVNEARGHHANMKRVDVALT